MGARQSLDFRNSSNNRRNKNEVASTDEGVENVRGDRSNYVAGSSVSSVSSCEGSEANTVSTSSNTPGALSAETIPPADLSSDTRLGDCAEGKKLLRMFAPLVDQGTTKMQLISVDLIHVEFSSKFHSPFTSNFTCMSIERK